MPGGTESAAPNHAALGPLRAEPARAAILLDLDGTLAPIVARPEEAAISSGVREALRQIARRFALTAIVTGRRASVARAIVGVDEIAYAGNHGFEFLAPGTTEPAPAPALAGHDADAPAFAATLDKAELEAVGIRVEDKGPIIALHWRGVDDERAAEELAGRITRVGEERGLVIHSGRKVLELRPRVAIDKGVAVAGLLGGIAVRAALYAGDDRTDLDAFRELVRRREAGTLDAIVRVGVSSDEGPSQIVEGVELVVEGPAGMEPLLEALAD